jgi:hypothetical protein
MRREVRAQQAQARRLPVTQYLVLFFSAVTGIQHHQLTATALRSDPTHDHTDPSGAQFS